MSVDISVRQLVNRLEDAASSERLDALQELQTLAKSDPKTVGEFSLQKVLELLREQGSPEEYEESLDLIYRLVKCRDKTIARTNTNLILSDQKNVELLLDLLEHENMTVGVMASQILTEIHSNDGRLLEQQIQDCPAGMNKLLGRLPDRSREEVRNQSISFIQQLTATNEEMKKTVVFNEGFEILFGIIHGEGGVEDAGVVVQDCLSICRNLLFDSETCQRLFFGMGPEWSLRLSEFFSPYFLETAPPPSRGNDSDESEFIFWADKLDKAKCAFLSLDALAGAVGILNPKHQQMLGVSITPILPSALFWVARGGPAYLVRSALLLLMRVAVGNAVVSAQISNMTLRLSPSSQGKNVPSTTSITHDLSFGWKPLPTDDRKCIAALSLLAERYIFAAGAWVGKITDLDLLGSTSVITSSEFGGLDLTTSEGLSQCCLIVLDAILAADSPSTGLLIQYVLAPPPPSRDDEDDEASEFGASAMLESMRPVASILLGVVVDVCYKVADSASTANQLYLSSAAFKADLENAERAANLLTLIFLHGGLIARELMTALSTSHVVSTSGTVSRNFHAQPSQPLLPFLLATVGRATRLPGTSAIVSSLLRMLAVAVSDCGRGTLQILEDPANFFVIDLCSAVSEAAGTSSFVQTMACLFLGSCYQALKVDSDGNGKDKKLVASEPDSRIGQSTLLGMIDSKVGLSRFTEILRKPLSSPRSGSLTGSTLSKEVFFTRTFRSHYEKQTESIRKGILEFYSTGDAGMDKDSPQQQVINMLGDKIRELETALEDALAGKASVNPSAQLLVPPVAYTAQPEILPDVAAGNVSQYLDAISEKERQINELQMDLATKDKIITDLYAKRTELENEAEELCAQVQAAELYREQHEQEIAAYNATIQDLSARLAASEHQALMNVGASSTLSDNSAELLAFRERVANLEYERSELLRVTRDQTRRIESLEDALNSVAPPDTKKIYDLTAKNQDLVAQVEQLTEALSQQRVVVAAPFSPMSAPSQDKDLPVYIDFRNVLSHITEFARRVGFEVEAESLKRHEESAQSAAAADLLLSNCADAIFDTANTLSDIAEMSNINCYGGLEGPEGSLERITCCFKFLRAQIVELTERVKMLGDVEIELDNAEAAKEGLVTELQSSRREVEALVVTVSELRDQNAKLMSTSSASDSSIVVNSTEMDNLRQQVQELEHKLEADQVKSNAEADRMLQKLVTLEQERGDYLNQIEELTANLKEKIHEQEVTASQQSDNDVINALRHRVKKLTDELEDVREKSEEFKKLVIPKLKEAQSALVLHEQERKKLHDEASRSEKVNKELFDLLTRSREESKVATDEAATLRGEIDVKDVALRMAESNMQKLADALKQSKKGGIGNPVAIDTNSGDEDLLLRQEFEDYRSSSARALEDANLRAESAEALLQMRDEKLQYLEDQFAAVCAEKNSLQTKCESLTANLSEAVHANDVRTLEVNLLAREAKLIEVSAECNALRQDLSHIKSERENLLEECSKLTQKLNNSTDNAEITSLREILLAKEKDLHALELQYVEIKEELVIARDEKRRVEEQCQTLSSTLETVTSRHAESITDLEAKLHRQALHLQTTEDECRALREELHATSMEREILLEECSKLKQSLDSTVDAAELDLLRGKLQDKVERLHEVTVMHTALRGELDAAVADKVRLTQYCDDLTEKLQAAQQQYQSAEEENEKMSESLSMKSFELSALTASHAQAMATIESQTAEIDKKQAMLEMLQQQLDAAKVRLSATDNVNDAIQTQLLEVERLNAKILTLSQELKSKDTEIHKALELCHRREGELAGLRSSLETLEADLAWEREQHSNTKQRAASDARTVKDLQREVDKLRTDLQLLELNCNGRSSDADSVLVEDVNNFVNNTVNWIHVLVAEKGTTSDSMIVCSPKIGEAVNKLRREVGTIVQELIDSFRSRIGSLEIEISSLNHRLNEASKPPVVGTQVMTTPVKATPTNATLTSTADQSQLVLSSRSATNSVNPTPEMSIVRRGASPGTNTKDFAKLHSELNAERRRLRALQEEHSDLLGLLAQQELELCVFRHELNIASGADGIAQAEEKAVIIATKKYGTYTSYRSVDENDDITAELQLLTQ